MYFSITRVNYAVEQYNLMIEKARQLSNKEIVIEDFTDYAVSFAKAYKILTETEKLEYNAKIESPF